jgi:Leucine carboxyl methyltransferase
LDSGTYVRTVAIDDLLYRFIAADDEQPAPKRQIISLGAGSDTRVFRFFKARPSIPLVYHELDFPVNTAAKVKAIRSTPLLQKALRIENPGDLKISENADALHSPWYHIHPIDLRTLPKSGASEPPGAQKKPVLPGLDYTLPTLLVSECCLVYLSPSDALNVIDYFATSLFPSSPTSAPAVPLGLILYEPIRPDDPFGKTMVSNLAVRGIQLQTLHKYASLEAQRERLQAHGFNTGQGAADVDFIWEKWVNDEEKERVASLEMLDEIEEWKLLSQHYCVAWGWREGQGNGGIRPFDRWRDVKAQDV